LTYQSHRKQGKGKKKDAGEHMYTALTPLAKKQFELFDF